MRTKVNVGIVGFGRIGAEHAGWLSVCQDVGAVAAADVTSARQAKAKVKGLRVFDDEKKLLKDPDVHAVLIATPTSMHFEQAMLALDAKKHVMVEKPMALDLGQAKELVEVAERRGLVLSVFHNRRWDADYLTVKKHVESGVFGQVINVESRLGQWSSCVGPAAKEYHPNWRNEASFGGGGLYDWGSHFVDQIWRLMWPARPVRVFAQLRGNVWTKDCDDFARVCIDFDNGATGMVEINTTTTRPLPRWHVDGIRGSGSAPYSVEFETRTWEKLEFTEAGATESQRLEPAPYGLNEPRIWQQFGAAIRGERPEPAVSARSVLPTMALLDAARASSREGKVIGVGGTAEWVY